MKKNIILSLMTICVLLGFSLLLIGLIPQTKNLQSNIDSDKHSDLINYVKHAMAAGTSTPCADGLGQWTCSPGWCCDLKDRACCIGSFCPAGVSGCSAPPSPPPPQPPQPSCGTCSINISASPSTIYAGQTSEISWGMSSGVSYIRGETGPNGGLWCCGLQSSGCKDCCSYCQTEPLSQYCLNCNNTVRPNRTQTYTLIVECAHAGTSDCGTRNFPVTVNVQYCGDGVCNGPEKCSSCPGDCGSCPAPPPPTPTPPPTQPPGPVCPASFLTYSASPNRITAGQNSIISWTTSNISSVKLWNGTIAPRNGSTPVTPSQTTSYSLTGNAATGCAPATQTVYVSVTVIPKPPTVSLSANPASITRGSSTSLSWSSSNATSLTINQNVGAVTPITSGSKPVSPTATTVYTITASGLGGTATASTSVTVTDPVAPNVTLVADPSSIKKGKCSNLRWTSSNAASLSIDHGINSVSPLSSGYIEVCPAETTTYTITASGTGGAQTASAQVAVDQCGADCVSETPEGILKFDQNSNQYYLLKDDNSKITLIQDPCVNINFQDYIDSRVKINGCKEDNKIRVLSIEKISTPAPPKPLVDITNLIATGQNIWFNLIVAVIISISLLLVIFKKRPEY